MRRGPSPRVRSGAPTSARAHPPVYVGGGTTLPLALTLPLTEGSGPTLYLRNLTLTPGPNPRP